MSDSNGKTVALLVEDVAYLCHGCDTGGLFLLLQRASGHYARIYGHLATADQLIKLARCGLSPGSRQRQSSQGVLFYCIEGEKG